MKELRKAITLPIFKLYLWLSGQSFEQFLQPYLPGGVIIGEAARQFQARFEANNTLARIAKTAEIPESFFYNKTHRILVADEGAIGMVNSAREFHPFNYETITPQDAVIACGGPAVFTAIQHGYCRL